MYSRGDKVLYRGKNVDDIDLNGIYEIGSVDSGSCSLVYYVRGVGWLWNRFIVGKVVGNRIVQRGDGCV